MRLTPHFRLSEFTRSETASRLGIDNNVNDPKVVDNLRRLCEKVLEPLRNHTNTPIVINSGYRCPRLNAAVGGSPTSNHLKGCAADLRLSSESQAKEWFEWLKAN
ncbi:MAG: D-Ala-D-Ala carboxypeptidase family metallohydrolase, partial [Prevotella sp.]|nr:D-Ala-D-Ala carboxypeptidase family metallohydrolase [Prevotella sp.]